MKTNDWDFGVTEKGFPMWWYTPEGYARITAQSEEYVESGQMERDDAFLRVYAANPMGMLANAVLNGLARPT